MSLTIQPGRYYIGQWYFDIPRKTEKFETLGPFGKGGNFMACVWREGADGGNGAKVGWTVQYRFRYYRDGRIHDHQDRLEWFSGEITAATEEEVEESTSRWVTQCSLAIGTLFDFYPVHGNSDLWLNKLQVAPPKWLHEDPRGPQPVER